MTLLQMQYFMEVCRCGSTLKAAQAAKRLPIHHFHGHTRPGKRAFYPAV